MDFQTCCPKLERECNLQSAAQNSSLSLYSPTEVSPLLPSEKAEMGIKQTVTKQAALPVNKTLSI